MTGPNWLSGMRAIRTTTFGLAIAAFAATATPNISMAMDPVDWDSANPNLPTNFFSGVGDQRIDILDIGDSGATNDGTIFQANPNPTEPSTGTGVFQPFKRVQRGTGTCNNMDCISVNGQNVATENGFNTDAVNNATNFDIVSGSWTRSVMMSELKITNGFIELQLDANQNGAAGSDTNKLVISDMQIFIAADNPPTTPFAAPEDGPNPNGVENSGYTGTIFDPSDNSLLGLAPAWQLDSGINGNVDILLQASICETPGQCGSGMGDMSVFIEVADLGTFSDTDQFVFYTEYLYVNDGFEEWRFGVNDGGNTGVVAEPGTLAIFGIGVIGLGWARRRKRAAKLPG